MAFDVLESLAQISSVVLVGGVFFAWRNFRTISLDSKLRVDRAAKEKSIEASEKYLDEHVKMFDEIYTAVGKEVYAPYAGKIGDFSPGSLGSGGLKAVEKKFQIHGIHRMFNTLELVAAYFVTGVADEKVGFKIIGRSFCANVERDYDFISACRVYPGHPFWYNVVCLYHIWRPRLKDTEIESTLEELERVAARLKSQSTRK
jgi:hypothetical protein